MGVFFYKPLCVPHAIKRCSQAHKNRYDIKQTCKAIYAGVEIYSANKCNQNPNYQIRNDVGIFIKHDSPLQKLIRR